MDLLDLARSAAERAGEYLRGVARPDQAEWVSKGRHDFVTEVDRTAERMITELLTAGAPGSRVVGEELAPEIVREGLAWIVDPLDGTTNFLHGFPAYAVSIAAAVDGRLEAGVVLDVPRNRASWATRGGGAWEDGRPLTVSPITDPSSALVGTGFPFKQLDRLEAYQRQFAAVIRGSSGVRRAGSAALDLVDVAAGRFDAFWELRLAPWDIAAGTLLVREAGGIITDLKGDDVEIAHTGVVAGNPALHRWLLETLRTAEAAQ